MGNSLTVISPESLKNKQAVSQRELRMNHHAGISLETRNLAGNLSDNKKPLGLCLFGDRYFCNVITLIIIMVWLSGRARFLGVDFLSG